MDTMNQKKCGGCTPAVIAKVLLIVGGLNWGLVGVGMLIGMPLNVVTMIFGSWPIVEAVVYLLVGIAAVMKLFGGCKCKKCAMCAAGAPGDMQKSM